MTEGYVNEFINEIKRCAFYRLSLEHEFDNKVLAKQIQVILQNKGFDVSINKNMLLIKWCNSSLIRNVANLNKNNDELSDYNKIRATSIASVNACAEFLRNKCLTDKKYLIYEKTETINIVKSLYVNNINKYINANNEQHLMINKIDKYDISLFDLEFIKQIVEVMSSGNFYHDIELKEEYILHNSDNEFNNPYNKTYLIKYYIITYPRLNSKSNNIS